MGTRGYENLTVAEARKMGKQSVTLPKRSKYGAKKTVVDGITFDSAKEANRYGILKMLASVNKIQGLEVQPVFAINVPSFLNPDKVQELVHIADYIADFRYYQGGKCVIEDVKSKATATPLYRLKKKLVEALYGVQIVEV